MEKEWYIEIEGKKEGPFSIEELRNDFRLTPDTLVWKKGFKRPLPIRKVPELKEVFADSKNQNEDKEEKTEAFKKTIGQNDEIALDMRHDPRNLLFFVLALLLILIYLLYLLER